MALEPYSRFLTPNLNPIVLLLSSHYRITVQVFVAPGPDIRHGIHVFYFDVAIVWVVILFAVLEVISPVSETPCNVVS